jgi:hypothetical protein
VSWNERKAARKNQGRKKTAEKAKCGRSGVRHVSAFQASRNEKQIYKF